MSSHHTSPCCSKTGCDLECHLAVRQMVVRKNRQGSSIKRESISAGDTRNLELALPPSPAEGIRRELAIELTASSEENSSSTSLPPPSPSCSSRPFLIPWDRPSPDSGDSAGSCPPGKPRPADRQLKPPPKKEEPTWREAKDLWSEKSPICGRKEGPPDESREKRTRGSG